LSKNRGTLERADVLGVLSLVFWSLMLVVTMKYLLFVMRADMTTKEREESSHCWRWPPRGRGRPAAPG
jgi:hypothetical protein